MPRGSRNFSREDNAYVADRRSCSRMPVVYTIITLRICYGFVTSNMNKATDKSFIRLIFLFAITRQEISRVFTQLSSQLSSTCNILKNPVLIINLNDMYFVRL